MEGYARRNTGTDFDVKGLPSTIVLLNGARARPPAAGAHCQEHVCMCCWHDDVFRFVEEQGCSIDCKKQSTALMQPPCMDTACALLRAGSWSQSPAPPTLHL